MSSANAANRRRLSTIIVPCWNKVAYTKECVRSIQKYTQSPYELILIDNASTDGTSAFLRTLNRAKGIRIIRNRQNIGFGQAINQGMTSGKGDYFIWLNSDTLVTSGWLDRMISCVDRFPDIGAVGPVVNDELLKDRSLDPNRIAALLSMRNRGKAKATYWLTGYCLLIKRAAMLQVGLLDRRFSGGNFEDYDYCLRLRQAGYEILIAEDAFVFHHWHRSFGDDSKRRRALEKNRELFIDKWCRHTLQVMTLLPCAQTLGRCGWLDRRNRKRLDSWRWAERYLEWHPLPKSL